MSCKISVPLDVNLYNEFIIRTGKSIDVPSWIESIVSDFLERTADDHPEWSDEYYLNKDSISNLNKLEGDGINGYYWSDVFLPNGTLVKMFYQGEEKIAEIKDRKLVYSNQSYTPSKFASLAAEGTSRNAWRDLLIKFPSQNKWVLANSLRNMPSRRN
jgi:hypothetical protein